jgi:tetratricopeptide (TPR) repeat protein
VRVCRLRGGSEPEGRDGVILTEAGLQVSTSQAPGRRHRAILDWLRAVAHPRPLVLWLDDVQWGAESLGLVATLLAHPVPALVLLTLRDEGERVPYLDEIKGDPRTQIIHLDPLDRAAHAELVRTLLPLDPEVAAHVVARTEGHPLFAVQLVGAWVAHDLLRPGPRGFVLAPGAQALLPDDIHALWTARLQEAVRQLGPEARRVVELAAVLGSEVGFDEWAAVAEEGGVEADTALADGLQRLGLARRTPDGFAFAHRLLRESTLRLAADAGRLVHWHHLCARVLGRRLTTPGMGERVAEHALAAGEPEAAAAALLEAGRQYSSQNHHIRARAVLDQLQALLDQHGAPADDPRRVQITLLLIMPRFAEGDLSALADLDRVEAAARHQHLEAEIGTILRIRGVIARTQGDYDAAARLLAEAEHRLRAVGALEQSGRATLGQVFLYQRNNDVAGALACLQRALADFEAVGDASWRLTTRYEQGRMLFHLGQLAQGRRSRRRGHPRRLAAGRRAQPGPHPGHAGRHRPRARPPGPRRRELPPGRRPLLAPGQHQPPDHRRRAGRHRLPAPPLPRRRHPRPGLPKRHRPHPLRPQPLAPAPHSRRRRPHRGRSAPRPRPPGPGLADADIASNVARSYIHLAERCALVCKGLGEPAMASRIGRLAVRLYGKIGDGKAATRLAQALGLPATP